MRKDTVVIEAKWLSVVVIGRNEAHNLERLFTSIFPLSDLIADIIYVDSASTDNSVEIASKYCDYVIKLKDSKFLNASIGRNIGTKHAVGQWILYLDGDMELNQEFINWLKTTDILENKNHVAGFVGVVKDIDITNYKERVVVYNNEEFAEHFGGAVLLNREIVIKAGNWSGSVFANEEDELYSRIKKLGYNILFLNIPMVVHYTTIRSKLLAFIDLFIPFISKKRFYGIGQSVVSSIEHRSFLYLFKINPLPFLILAMAIFNIIFILLTKDFGMYLAFILIVLELVIISYFFPLKKIALSLGLAFRIPFGLVYSLLNKKYTGNFDYYYEKTKGEHDKTN